jgi:hypothetical protein
MTHTIIYDMLHTFHDTFHTNNNKHAYAGQIEQFYTCKSPEWYILIASFWAQSASGAEGRMCPAMNQTSYDTPYVG